MGEGKGCGGILSPPVCAMNFEADIHVCRE